ncbi:MAG: hypothetical protein V2A34_08685, partial [Lentisphaerota bacterium]
GYTSWASGIMDRGAPTLAKQSHDWVNHATRGDYDTWYLGTNGLEEGLQAKTFEIRPGVNTPKPYGMMYSPGMLTDSWAQVVAIADTNLAKLARSVLHASVFETAFHNEGEHALDRWSSGDYIYPATGSNSLSSFAKYAQSQSRLAAIYERVDDWASVASGITTPQTSTEDVDLDGEDEYLLFNDRLFAVFERIGGRMIGCWTRDILSGSVFQGAGNMTSYSGSETEEESATNMVNDGSAYGGVLAYRTSCLKDWHGKYANDMYSMTDWTNGWRATSSDSAVQKTITLTNKSWSFEVRYSLSGAMAGQTLYIRNGLSPDLYSLLVAGQTHLGGETASGGVLTLANTNYDNAVLAQIGYADGAHNTVFNPAARDDGAGYTNFALRMRNQAQTHQVELYGTNTFSFSLGFRAMPSDWNSDGMPNAWADQYGLPTNALGGATQDADSDGIPNKDEYIANTDPNSGTDYLHVSQSQNSSTGLVIRFPTKAQREYSIWYMNNGLMTPSWSSATNGIPGTGGTVTWEDNGTATAPHPFLASNRYYRIDVELPR